MIEVKKKMGRPTNNHRNRQINLRLSEKELATLNECAKVLDTTRVEIVVKGINKIYNEIK